MNGNGVELKNPVVVSGGSHVVVSGDTGLEDKDDEVVVTVADDGVEETEVFAETNSGVALLGRFGCEPCGMSFRYLLYPRCIS